MKRNFWFVLCLLQVMVISSPAPAQFYVVRQIPLPSNCASYVTVNPNLNKIYLTGSTGGPTLSVVDGSTLSLSEVGTGTCASVDLTTDNYWAAGVYGGTVIIRSGKTNAAVASPSLGYCPVGTSLDPNHRRAWVTAQCGGGNDPVFVLNADNYSKVKGPIGSGGVLGPPIVNPATGRTYLQVSGKPKRVDPNTFAVTNTSFSVVAAVNANANRLYSPVTNGLQVIDGAPDPEVILKTVPLSFTPSAVDVDASANKVYAADYSGNRIAIIEGWSDFTVNYYSLGEGISPYSIKDDYSNDRLYVLASTSSGNVLVVLSTRATAASGDEIKSSQTQSHDPDWVYVTRQDCVDLDIHLRLYVDAASVVRSGNTLHFTTLTVDEKPDELYGTVNIICNDEAKFENIWMIRTLESHSYDAGNKETDSVLEPDEWKSADQGEVCGGRDPSIQLIEAALKYAPSN